MSGIPLPDCPSGEGEFNFVDAARLTDVQSEESKQAMGISPVSLFGGAYNTTSG